MKESSTKLPPRLRQRLFSIAAIDLKTAKLIEQHARRLKLFPLPTTTSSPYLRSRKRQPFLVSFRRVVRYVYGALVQGELSIRKRKLATRRSLHYTEVAASLGLATNTVYRIFRDYFDSHKLSVKQKIIAQKLGKNGLKSLNEIRETTRLIHYHGGFHRPRQLLVRVNQPPNKEPEVEERYRSTCGQCMFFDAEAQLCALWHHVATIREDLVEEARAGRRQVSRRLHGCRHFTSKTKYKIPKLTPVAFINPEKGVRKAWRCARAGCSGLLDRPPRVGVIAHCLQCGTTYRKTPHGDIKSELGTLDLLQHTIRNITGILPQTFQSTAESRPLEKIMILLKPDDALIDVSPTKLIIAYHNGGLQEVYPLESLFLTLS